MIDPQELPPPAVCADLLGVSVRTVRRWLDQGKMPDYASRFLQAFALGDLAAFDEAFMGFKVRGDEIVDTTSGVTVSAHDLRKFHYMRQLFQAALQDIHATERHALHFSPQQRRDLVQLCDTISDTERRLDALRDQVRGLVEMDVSPMRQVI